MNREIHRIGGLDSLQVTDVSWWECQCVQMLSIKSQGGRLLCQPFVEGLGKPHDPPSEKQETRKKNVAADEQKMDSSPEEQALCISKKSCSRNLTKSLAAPAILSLLSYSLEAWQALKAFQTEAP